jgi:hypothetical protein
MRRASVALLFRLIPCTPLPASTDDFVPAVAKPLQQHRWLGSPVAFVYFMESWKCRIRNVKARFYHFVTVGTLTGHGGRVTTGRSITLTGLPLACVGDIVTYSDGARAVINDSPHRRCTHPPCSCRSMSMATSFNFSEGVQV